MLKGIAVSKGIAIGKVFKYEQPTIKLKETQGSPNEELVIFEEALHKTIADIEKVKVKAAKSLSANQLVIFDAHLMLVKDPEYQKQITDLIKTGVNADLAIKTISEQLCNVFASMEDAYFKERVSDVNDICFHLMCNIAGQEIPDLSEINEKAIIVADDLVPSDTATLNTDYVLGFATNIGGPTSHSAIMARTLEIPAIVGTKDILSNVEHGDLIILDALDGEIIINPDLATVNEYRAKEAAYLSFQEKLKTFINDPSVCHEGRLIDIGGNIGMPKDVEGVKEVGGDSIGLYRTEFLYMNSRDDFPSEESQFEAYKEVLEAMKGKKVVVRTLDIGGDKELNYFEFPKELNPFLGYRAIRLCLDHQDIFRTQLRALLRASSYGQLAIMFPMIATIDELKKAKAIFEEEKAKLVSEGVKIGDKIEIGMMVEIPSAALMADQFAKYCDFFSIGTNDLIQYTMAADRTSPTVSYLYQPLNPALLKLIKTTTTAAHKLGKWCGICGEMANDPCVIPMLIGLGIDEISISANGILNVRQIIKHLDSRACESLVDEALNCETCVEVQNLVKNKLQK